MDSATAVLDVPVNTTGVEANGVETPSERPMTLREARRRFERDWIAAALERNSGRMAETARSLGIQRTNLYRKMRQLQVSRARAEAQDAVTSA